MDICNNALNALNLFKLTVQGQWGIDWKKSRRQGEVSSVADDVVTSLKGEIVAQEVNFTVRKKIKTWKFPDGSQVKTGDFGMKIVSNEEEAAENNGLS